MIVVNRVKWLVAVVAFAVKRSGVGGCLGILGGVCSDHGEHCSIVMSMVRV